MTEPRIPPLPPDEWGDDVRAGIAALRPPGTTQELRRSKGGPRGLNVLGTLAQHPALMQAYHTFNGHILYTNTLDARQRELLVLRVAARRGAEYEWRQHVFIARDLGFTEADIEFWSQRPPKTHPLVWRHEHGRKSLVLGATTDHVEGMSEEEGRAYLADLLDRSTVPERVYRHEWAVGDLVIWDNRGVLHRATRYDPSSARDMHRTTIAGSEAVQ